MPKNYLDILECLKSYESYGDHKINLNYPDAANVIIHSTFVYHVITSTDELKYSKSWILDLQRILKSGSLEFTELKDKDDKV